MMRYLGLAEVIDLHRQIIEQSQGAILNLNQQCDSDRTNVILVEFLIATIPN